MLTKLAVSAFIVAATVLIAFRSGDQVMAVERPGSGDADCSGRANSYDAHLVLRYNAGLIDELPCRQAANTYIDTALDGNDAAAILRYEAGLYDALPWIPESVLQSVLDSTAQLTGQPTTEMTVVHREVAIWSNSCLGIERPDQGCLAVITWGWRVAVAVEGHVAMWHVTSAGGRRLATFA